MPLHCLLRLSPTAVLGLWHRTETAAALGALLPAGAPYPPCCPPPPAPSARASGWPAACWPTPWRRAVA
ncbi:hypothetical protein, partial [Hymenobacter coccineus]|uniref:hypothetical protein n=1 Tax=Hymenobacter coccineus TaxID=1908235 RepID=UPI001955A4F3